MSAAGSFGGIMMVQIATPAVLQSVERVSPNRVANAYPIVLLELGGVGDRDLACVANLTAGLGGNWNCTISGLLLTSCSQL